MNGGATVFAFVDNRYTQNVGHDGRVGRGAQAGGDTVTQYDDFSDFFATATAAAVASNEGEGSQESNQGAEQGFQRM